MPKSGGDERGVSKRRLPYRHVSKNHKELSDAGAEFREHVALAVDKELEGVAVVRSIDLKATVAENLTNRLCQAARFTAIFFAVAGFPIPPLGDEGLACLDVEVGLRGPDAYCVPVSRDVNALRQPLAQL